MGQFSSVFSQILKLFPRAEFAEMVKRHEGDRHAKGFRCWTQFVSMTFCQLGRAQSLREITDGLRSCEGKLQHLGIEAPARSTLAYANKHRPWQLYRDVFAALLHRCEALAPGHRFRFKNKLYSLDATTITLCASMFDWARYKRKKEGVKVHLVLDHDGYLPTYAVIREAKVFDIEVARGLEFPEDSIVVFDRAYNDFQFFYDLTRRSVFFVTRIKEATRFVVREERQPPARSPVTADQTIVFVKEFENVAPEPMRRVVVRGDDGEEIAFLPNIFHLSARTIGQIYRSRWEIEKFFRAIKQNLRIKTFVGTSENALHIQIWTALIALLTLRYLTFLSTYRWSLSNFVAMLRHQLFVHRDLRAWLDAPFKPPPEPDLQAAFAAFG
ncbi:MAG TPA: IS4 family transposase [Thermoanaerobaculia bacterium]|nr:IS4 family transposase [Thermoanaerobaculia bacterium]